MAIPPDARITTADLGAPAFVPETLASEIEALRSYAVDALVAHGNTKRLCARIDQLILAMETIAMSLSADEATDSWPAVANKQVDVFHCVEGSAEDELMLLDDEQRAAGLRWRAWCVAAAAHVRIDQIENEFLRRRGLYHKGEGMRAHCESARIRVNCTPTLDDVWLIYGRLRKQVGTLPELDVLIDALGSAPADDISKLAFKAHTAVHRCMNARYKHCVDIPAGYNFKALMDAAEPFVKSHLGCPPRPDAARGDRAREGFE